MHFLFTKKPVNGKTNNPKRHPAIIHQMLFGLFSHTDSLSLPLMFPSKHSHDPEFSSYEKVDGHMHFPSFLK